MLDLIWLGILNKIWWILPIFGGVIGYYIGRKRGRREGAEAVLSRSPMYDNKDNSTTT